MPDAALVATLFIVFCGSGVFLRLVAKEKHWREKNWLAPPRDAQDRS